MTLTPEDGSGIAAADTWITLSEYDAFLADVYNETRSEADAATEAAIRRGARYIGTLDLEGVRTYGRSQGTCLPRSGLTDIDGVSIGDTEIPTEFKLALFYMARAELASPNSLTPIVDQSSGGGGGQIKRIRKKVDVIETETEYSVPTSSSTSSSADASKSGTQLAIERSRAIVTAAMDILKPFMKTSGGYRTAIMVV